MSDPRAISTGSNMPSYSWLHKNNTDFAALSSKIRVQRMLGVPFPAWSPAIIDDLAHEQAKQIAKDLRDQGRYIEPDKEIVALISYLQCLGKKSHPVPSPTAAK